MENVIKVTLHVKVSLIKQKNILSCPFHSLAYEIACEAVIAKSKQIIDNELGHCYTSMLESSHNVLLQFRTKI